MFQTDLTKEIWEAKQYDPELPDIEGQWFTAAIP